MFVYSTTLLFSVEFILFSIMLSHYKYIPNGNFEINNEGLTWEKKLHPWNEINKIQVYYRGDNFWKPFLSRYTRYNNLSLHISDGMNEKMLEKIVVNDNESIYLKSRNENEKHIFCSIEEIAMSKGVLIENVDTDFSYNLFGRENNYYEEIGKFPFFWKKNSHYKG